jgi:hypothetical protein
MPESSGSQVSSLLDNNNDAAPPIHLCRMREGAAACELQSLVDSRLPYPGRALHVTAM